MIETDPLYMYRATVKRIIDGDTVDLRVNLGFKVCIDLRFRLFGINAPEKRGKTREAGLASKSFLEQLAPVGKELLIETIKDRQGKWGRYLAKLHSVGGAINDLMVTHGHAEYKEY